MNKYMLSDIAKFINGELYGNDMIVSNFSIDSRTIRKDDMFICIKGKKYDGHDFISHCIKKASCLITSKEITDINNLYLSSNKLKLISLNSDVSWIDTGTYGSLIKASKYFEDFENKTGKKAACVEEIAFEMGYINQSQLRMLADSMQNSEYGKYLLNITPK